MAHVWKSDPVNPDPEAVSQAAELLRSGRLVAIPTETVYGLAANALDEFAVQTIFAVKGRPSTNPLIVHVESEDDMKRVASSISDAARMLMQAFWPGPLSLVLPKQPHVPQIVTASGPTVAVRCPNHAVARAIIRMAGVPLAAPSANRSNEISPTKAEHVVRAFESDERVAGIMDAGPCQVGIESTVLDVSGAVPKILRPGMITRPMIEAVVGPIADEVEPSGIAKSPGMMARHYCPQTPLFLVHQADFHKELQLAQEAGQSVGLVGWDWTVPDQYARGLFDALHRLDQGGFDGIFAWLPPEEPQWAGVRDRLMRAAAKTKAE
ncbi:MAG: L-threonylcarbamoyladenylate synthase [Gemmataceae bacterium]